MVVKKKFRTALVWCVALLVLQLFSPLMLQAAGLPGVPDEVTLRSADPDDPSNSSGHDVDLGLPGTCESLSFTILLRNTALDHQHSPADRSGSSLLPTTGLQPSAP